MQEWPISRQHSLDQHLWGLPCAKHHWLILLLDMILLATKQDQEFEESDKKELPTKRYAWIAKQAIRHFFHKTTQHFTLLTHMTKNRENSQSCFLP